MSNNTLKVIVTSDGYDVECYGCDDPDYLLSLAREALEVLEKTLGERTDETLFKNETQRSKRYLVIKEGLTR